MERNGLGHSPRRKESLDKVMGKVIYGNDHNSVRMLHGALKTSPHASAKIVEIKKEKAEKMPGVKGVLTGNDLKENIGLYLCDKPPIARGVVRHYGEVVAAVIAESVEKARAAADVIEVVYEKRDPILSPKDALKEGAPVIHEEMATYSHIKPIHPEPGSNVANRSKIRKGDVKKAFDEAAYMVETNMIIPPGDHVAMEPRVSIAEIKSTGEVHIISSTQAPFVVKNLMCHFFGLQPGQVVVTAPMVGGGFGGKAGIQLEGLAYLMSLKVGGRPVKLANTREQDLLSSPGHIGLESNVKIAADAKGKLLGMDLTYWFNSGAYADYAVNISRAAAIACTGPYNVPNVTCDSMCVYTNMPFATAYRGFGHVELAFGIERAMDELADKMQMDPVELRRLNCITEGDETPVQSLLNSSTGDLKTCFKRVEAMLGGSVGIVEKISDEWVKAKGIAGLWKAPAMPTNTDAGAVLTFNSDGSCNVNTGVVEIGQGTKTGIAQIAADVLGLPIEKVHVVMEVNTRTSPSDWATAGSRSLFMAGLATHEACIDAVEQIKEVAAAVLRVPKSDLVLKNERVYAADEPAIGLPLSEVALGYVYPNGNAVYGQIIGKGRYIAKHLTDIDQHTGKGHPDLEWTLGAEGVEVDVNIKTGQYKIVKAVCCIDVGKVINPDLARGQIVGGMAMGMGYTTMEGFKFNDRGQVVNGSLRDYKIMRLGDQPEYEVEFLETPQLDGPYGARGLGEQAVIGMPGAIGNALSRAIGKGVYEIPITSERLYKKLMEV